MLTIITLIIITVLASLAIAQPVISYVRKPWLFNAPNGEAEALRQEQIMALDSLRDLAMDYRMGQLSREDYRALAAPLQKKAKQRVEPIEQSPSTGIVEKRLAKLDAELEATILSLRNVKTTTGHTELNIETNRAIDRPVLTAAQFCTQCGEKAEPSFRFCAACGSDLLGARGSSTGAETPIINTTRSGTDAATLEVASVNAENVLTSSDVKNSYINTPDLERVDAETMIAETAVQPIEATANEPSSKESSIGRWWIASGIVTAIWIGAIVWIYLNGRAGQQTQVPVATVPDGPVIALAATTEQTLVSSTEGLSLSTDLAVWEQSPTDDILLSITPVDEDNGVWIGAGALGLWQTSDSGESWISVENQNSDIGIQLVATDESGLLWGANIDSLFMSADKGRSWSLANDSLPGIVRALASGSGEIFIGTNQGVFRSPDQGQTWIDSNSVVNGRIGSTDIQALAYDEEGKILFAGTPRGLHFLNLESVGGWGQRSLTADVRSLAIPSGANNILWVGTAEGEIYRSTDRGVTWRN